MCWRTSSRTLVAAILLFLPLSCTRISGPATVEEGGLTVERLDQLGSVPAAYGELISVTDHPTYAGETLLWFHDDAGTVRIVRYHQNRNRLSPIVLVISRSMGGM